jgi:RsiW-degrading membrane proteinase PrsW (M82 family)
MADNCVTIRLHRPSLNELLFFVLSGAIVSVPLTLFVESFADPLLVGFSAFDVTVITVILFAPLVEEFAKVFPLFYRHGETQRSIFNLAICVGLGFGIVEFLTYVGTYGTEVLPARIPGLLFHPASASITAYGIATKRPLPYYLVAVSLHFANNIFAIVGSTIVPSTAIVFGITLYTSWYLRGKTTEKFIETDYATAKVLQDPNQGPPLD